MKKKSLKIVSILLAIALVMQLYPANVLKAATNNTIKITVQYGQTEARSILDMINELRTGDDAWYWSENDSEKIQCVDLQPLTYDYDLEKVAMLRAAEIAVSYAHTRPNGSNCFSAYEECGYSWQYSCGENIAAGYFSASEVNSGWREDNENYDGQGHRRNMLNSRFKAVGIGHVKFNGIDYWVEEFSGNVPQNSETAANDQKEECSVEIDEENIMDAKLTGKKTTISLKCGEKFSLSDLSVAISYNKYWNYLNKTFPINMVPDIYSENTEIASCSDGKVTGVSEGETKLTANVFGKQASITVSVKKDEADITPAPTPTVEPTKTPEPAETPTPAPTPTVEPTKTPEPAETPTLAPTQTAKPTKTPDTDKKYIKFSEKGIDYKVISKSAVTIVNIAGSKKTVIIPDTITINKQKFTVTAIRSDAFKNCKKVTKLTIGKNIRSLNKSTFANCKALKKITIKSTVINKNDVKTALLSQINKTTTLLVPKSRYKSYKQLIKTLGKSKKYIVLSSI